MTQGNLATAQGKILENLVEYTFLQHGFRSMSHAQFQKSLYDGGDVLLKNVPFTNIYGSTSRTEFAARSPRLGLNLRIECKWQQSSGSVDKKFPYLSLNCMEAMPEPHVIILIDGGGYRPAALHWLEQAVAQRRYAAGNAKRVDVMNMGQFVAWANAALR